MPQHVGNDEKNEPAIIVWSEFLSQLMLALDCTDTILGNKDCNISTCHVRKMWRYLRQLFVFRVVATVPLRLDLSVLIVKKQLPGSGSGGSHM